jgi:hypothetical protein
LVTHQLTNFKALERQIIGLFFMWKEKIKAVSGHETVDKGSKIVAV